MGWLSLLCEQRAVPVVLLSTHAAQIVHAVFVFSNHHTECGERWFWYPRTLLYHPTTSTMAVLQNSCHLSNIFVHFRCSHPFAQLCVFNRLLTGCKPAMPSKYHITRHGRVIKCFYKHFLCFRSCKSRFNNSLGILYSPLSSYN